MARTSSTDLTPLAESVKKLNKSTTFIGVTQVILAIAMLILVSVQIWIQLTK